MPSLKIDWIKKIQEKYSEYNGIKVFIETGTHHGETIFSLSVFFEKLYTIEIEPDLCKKLLDTVKRIGVTNVTLLFGDSTEFIPKILKEITQPAIFFLDAHFSHCDTGKGKKDVPLLEEITAIGKLHNENSIIIIDDYELFGKSEPENWSDISVQNILDCLDPSMVSTHYLMDNRLIILLKKVSKMNLVFDIGYNVGNFTREILRLYPDCRVVGVEANSKLDTKPISSQVTLIRALVSSTDGNKTKLYIGPIVTASEDLMKNSRFAKGSKVQSICSWDKFEWVDTITLDSLVKQFGNPDFIKIDVEGLEYAVLVGLTSKQKMISFEWEEELFHIVEGCVQHLSSLGYEKFCVAGYFDEGDVFPYLEYDKQADTYGLIPKKFFKWSELQDDLKKMLHPERRMNYGMVFAV